MQGKIMQITNKIIDTDKHRLRYTLREAVSDTQNFTTLMIDNSDHGTLSNIDTGEELGYQAFNTIRTQQEALHARILAYEHDIFEYAFLNEMIPLTSFQSVFPNVYSDLNTIYSRNFNVGDSIDQILLDKLTYNEVDFYRRMKNIENILIDMKTFAETQLRIPIDAGIVQIPYNLIASIYTDSVAIDPVYSNVYTININADAIFDAVLEISLYNNFTMTYSNISELSLITAGELIDLKTIDDTYIETKITNSGTITTADGKSMYDINDINTSITVTKSSNFASNPDLQVRYRMKYKTFPLADFYTYDAVITALNVSPLTLTKIQTAYP